MDNILVGIFELEKGIFNSWSKKHIEILDYNQISLLPMRALPIVI